MFLVGSILPTPAFGLQQLSPPEPRSSPYRTLNSAIIIALPQDLHRHLHQQRWSMTGFTSFGLGQRRMEGRAAFPPNGARQDTRQIVQWSRLISENPFAASERLSVYLLAGNQSGPTTENPRLDQRLLLADRGSASTFLQLFYARRSQGSGGGGAGGHQSIEKSSRAA